MEKITDLIDDKAFAQLERLLRDLGIAQSEFVKLATDVEKVNSELGKVKGFKDFEQAVGKAAEAQQKMAEASKVVQDAGKRAMETEKQIVETTKAKITTMASAKSALDTYSGTLDENIKMQIRLKLAISDIQKQQKAVTKDFNDGKISIDEFSENIEYLTKAELEAKEGLRDFNLEIKRSLKEANAAESSYDSISATLDRLRGLYKRLNEEERNNAEVGGELLKSIQEYDAKLKELDKSMGVYNRNVGNYTSATEDLTKAASGLFPELGKIQKSYEDGKNAIIGTVNVLKDYISGKYAQEAADKAASIAAQKAAIAEEELAAGKITTAAAERARTAATAASTAATNASSTSLKLFRLALISTGVGAIVVLLGSLVTYLLSTQEGIDKVTAVTRPLQAIFQSLLGVAQNLGKILFEAFLNPQKAVKDLKELLVNFFKDPVQGIKDMASATEKFVSEAIERGKQIDRLQKEIEKNNIAIAREQEALNRSLSESQEILKDTSKSEAERAAAAQQAYNDIKRIEELKLSDIDKRIDKLVIEQQLNDTNRKGNLELAQLEAERDKVAAEAAKSRIGITKTLNQVEKQIAAEAAKASKEAADARKKAEQEALDALNKRLQAEFQLEASRIKRASDRNRLVVDDEKLSMEDRLSNLQQFVENEEKLLKLRLKNELRNTELAAEDRIRLQEETEAEIEAIKRKASETSLKILTDQLTAEDKERVRAAASIKAGIERERDERLKALSDAYQSGEISEQEYANTRLQIQRDFTTQLINQEIKAVEDLIKVNKARGLDTFEQEKQIAALRLKLSQETTDRQIEDAKKLLDEERIIADARKELQAELANLAITLVNAQFEKEFQNIDVRQKKLEEQKKNDLERVKESVDSEENKAIRIAQIEQRAQKQNEALENKKRAIQRQQAVFEKASNVASAIMATISASLAALRPPPIGLGPIAGIPLAATIAAIGATRVASIIATPLPAFADGTKNSPEGPAIVGEKGPELRINPDGSAGLTPGKASLTYLKKGTQIIPADETRKIMAMSGMASITGYDRNGNSDNAKLEKILTDGFDRLEKSAKNKKQYSTVITSGGVHHMYRTANSRQEYLKRNL